MVCGLCGFGNETSSPLEDNSESPPSNNAETTLVPPPPQQVVTPSTPLETEEKTGETEEKTDDVTKQPLPLPPGRAMKETCSSNNLITKSASTRKLSSTLSVKNPRSMSMKPKVDQDSSLGKTIDGNSGIQNGDGNLLKGYHPKTMSTRSMSRTTSFREPDMVPSKVDQDSSLGKTNIDANSVIQNGEGSLVKGINPKTMSFRSMSRTTSFREPDMVPNQHKGKGIITRKEEEDYVPIQL
ncbi:hypothetical protein COLO4_21082 [Corchorus olitorius]|uniref:Uncharacterized protein n=1 Tax=Corchorus olitorius TaxID=93759 RepID=A0A1R3IVD8_9ROSI|nr:hypothetical protein COLO4_21082 [Corchorus olitorius]